MWAKMTLGSGHSLILSNKPDSITLERVNEKAEKENESLVAENFGLFDIASNNYSNYYPDVKKEDLEPKDEEFIKPVFRLLSNVIIQKGYAVIEMSKDPLKASAQKLVGQSVYPMHDVITGSELGVVQGTSWQESYKAKNGMTIPAGINGQLLIDGKSNPKIARGINMKPPSVHSASVGIIFEWDKSHPKMDDHDFFSSLGKYDKNGQLIRQVMKEVHAYQELSMVPHGADIFAQKLDDNMQINNPDYAKSMYKFSADDFISGKGKTIYHFMDYKNLSNLQFSNQNKESNMDYIQFMATLMGLSGITEENFQEAVKTHYESLKSTSEEAITLKATNANLTQELSTVKAELEEAKKIVPADPDSLQAMVDTRAEVERVYTLSVGEKKDTTVSEIIAKADLKTLKVLKGQYEQTLDSKFPLVCKKCSSTEVSRKTSETHDKGDGNSHVPKDREELRSELKIRGNKNTTFFKD